ncbi:hypothetical protein [Streptomyces sp. RPT161]|uniref:hypothetical protein n=1 Tax=Streptomyces sp. RPT161 TaxID=3015993 RepID=UPI0022B936F2|nr:hypothetical protein [Streptomyces sp. RPT161]
MRDAREAARQEFVSSVARQAVATVAPEELAFFAPLAAEFARRGEVRCDHRYSDGIIESGWDAAVALVTPVALTLASSLYNRLTDNVSDEIIKRGSRELGRAWSRLRGRRRADANAATAPEAEHGSATAADLRDQLLQRAGHFQLPPESATALVDALLAVVAKSATGEDGSTGNGLR